MPTTFDKKTNMVHFYRGTILGLSCNVVNIFFPNHIQFHRYFNQCQYLRHEEKAKEENGQAETVYRSILDRVEVTSQAVHFIEQPVVPELSNLRYSTRYILSAL